MRLLIPFTLLLLLALPLGGWGQDALKLIRINEVEISSSYNGGGDDRITNEDGTFYYLPDYRVRLTIGDNEECYEFDDLQVMTDMQDNTFYTGDIATSDILCVDDDVNNLEITVHEEDGNNCDFNVAPNADDCKEEAEFEISTTSEEVTESETLSSEDGCASYTVTIKYNYFSIPANELIDSETIVPLCDEQTDTLAADPRFEGLDVDYRWYKDNTNTPNNELGDEHTQVITGPGTYILEVKAGGCTATQEIEIVEVNLNETETISIEGGDNFCQFDDIQLTASPSQNQNILANNPYSWNQASFQDSSTISLSSDTPVENQEINLTVKYDNGCTLETSTTISIKCNPPPQIGTVGPACAGEQVTLEASAPMSCNSLSVTWEWGGNLGELDTAISTLPLEGPMSFSVTATYSHGDNLSCTNSTSESFTGIPVPIATAETNQVLTLCNGNRDPIDLCLPLTTANTDVTFEVESDPSGSSTTSDDCELGSTDVNVATRIQVTANNQGCISEPYFINLEYPNFTPVSTIRSDFNALTLEALTVDTDSSDLCQGSGGILFRIPEDAFNTAIDYKWAVSDFDQIDWTVTADSSSVLMTFSNVVGNDIILHIKAEDACGDYECKSFNLPLDRLIEATPSVIFNQPSNSLIVLDNTADSYQWGYENKSSLLGEVFPQGTYQDLIPSELGGHTFDETANYYYVRLTYPGGCVTKAYYNPPDLSDLQDVGSCDAIELTSTAALPDVEALQVFPNPNTGSYQLQWASSYQGEVTLGLFDTYGRAVQVEQAQKQAPVWQHRMQHTNLPAGLYLLRLRTADGQQLTRKLLIQNR